MRNLTRYGFLVLGATIALNAFSEPVVESRSATDSSSSAANYPFSDSDVVETTTTNNKSAAPSAAAVSNPYSSPIPAATSSANTNNTNLNSAGIPADIPGGAVQSVNTFNAMQQDIQNLRGMVEELQYKVQQLEQQEKDRFVSTDNRLRALEGGGVAAPAATDSTSTSTDTSSSSASGAAQTANPEQEKAEYDTAFNYMTKDKNFDKATKAFSDFVQHYPSGSYTPNALYWLGKLYSFDTKNLTKARDAFQQVVKQFPTSAKGADALYELGVTYHKLNDKAQAKKLLKSVSTQYPGSGAALKAEQYLKENPL